jgi:hypothetical protein
MRSGHAHRSAFALHLLAAAMLCCCHMRIRNRAHHCRGEQRQQDRESRSYPANDVHLVPAYAYKSQQSNSQNCPTRNEPEGFYTAHFNPYLNFHRPCGYAVLKPGTRGRTRRVYAADDYRTPLEKLSSLTRRQLYLKPGLTAALLRQQASRRSDTDAAKLMQKAKLNLLKRVQM